MSEPRHFLDIDRIPAETLRTLVTRGTEMKASGRGSAIDNAILAGRTLALIFEKPSTRTRVSFEVGMRQLGGHVVVLNAGDTQLGRGETIEDTARTLSRYVDAIMLRTNDSSKLERLAQAASVPIINGLSDLSHPCQVMADVLTIAERRAGGVAGAVVAWIGACNNVARSWAHAAERFGFTFRIACPEGIDCSNSLSTAPGVTLIVDPQEAVAGADCVVTDVWVSMNDQNAEERRRLLAPYRVDSALMARARPDAFFLHCLPARRGEEVTDSVIDGPQSAVWDEAENRLHMQKAILEWCLA